MERQTSKVNEQKFVQLLLFSFLSFGIVISVLNYLSMEPNLKNIQFYVLLVIVLAFLYKPFAIFLLKNLLRIIKSVKSMICSLLFRDGSKIDMAHIDQLSGIEFEKFLKPYLEKQGYRTELPSAADNYGADFIIKKGTKKYVVQVKQKKSKVGIKAVREVVGAIKHYEANGAIIITNHYFTSSAKNYALSNDIKLIDRDGLTNMIQTSNKKYRLATALSLTIQK